MSSSQEHLHSENFDLCRICLLEPESNRHVKFLHIFLTNNDGIKLSQHVLELLDVRVDKDDIKPKFICENCHTALLSWIEMKKKAAESQIVINYIAKKKFSGTSPGTNQTISNPSDHSFNQVDKGESSKAPRTSTRLQTKSKMPKNSVNNLRIQNNSYGPGCSSQGDFGESFNQSTIASESDDDISCQEVSVLNEVICISDSEESVDNNVKREFLNNEKRDELKYCSICRKKTHSNHDCSQNNKEFSTCLVPSCHILSRSMRDFKPHYRQHIGMPTGAILCRFCFKEIKKSERDINGFHTHCSTVNLFKCYACHLMFKSMGEFAFHKLKHHNGRLINSTGNFLCFHCEKSSPDLLMMTEHTKVCLANQIKNQNNVTEHNMQPEEPELAVNTNEFLITKKKMKVAIVKKKVENIPRSSQHKLFTCLKPSCNLIFQSFMVFKFHHREHFGIGNQLMCWQCCLPFSSLNSLRIHQVKGNCRTPGMFKCYECHEKYNDLQSLSIHKYIMHDGELICNKKSLICAFCKLETSAEQYKSHLIKCQSRSELIKNKKYSFKCKTCGKVCLTAQALASHHKIHNPTLSNLTVKNRRSYTSLRSDEHDVLPSTSFAENERSTMLPSTSQSSVTIESVNYVANTSNNIDADEEISPSLSNASQNNGKINSTNYDMFPFVDNFYLCIKCPKKFNTKPGIARHWFYCANTRLNPAKSLPTNYYCTKCKESYTRIGFGEHWKLIHGKRLPSNKFRQYSCPHCAFKFKYKIALSMHIEHVHSKLEISANIACHECPINSDETLPIIVSGAKSLAEDYVEKSMENNLNEQIECEENTNLLLDISNVQSEELVNINENIINEQVIEVDDSRISDKHDLSNNNDDGNEDNVQIENTDGHINELYEGENKTEKYNDDDKMDVDHETKLKEINETTECEKNVSKGDVTNEVNNQKNNITVKEEANQNGFFGMVATDDTSDMDVVVIEDEMINLKQEYATSSKDN